MWGDLMESDVVQLGCCVLFGIGIFIGVELGRAFSFWKW